jgi:STE24 endopeptidase
MIQIVLILIFPSVIQPLFNKVEPLEEGDLKKDIEELAKKLTFPLSDIYVIDGSKRSSHSNAYFYGLFNKKRIVIFDTLIQQQTKDEILSIIGHGK